MVVSVGILGMLFLAVLLAGGCLFLQQEQGTARPSITVEAREGKKRRSKKSKQAKKESESGKDTLLTASTDSLKSLATDEDDGEPPFPPSEHLQQEQVPKQSRKLVLGAAKPEPSAGDSPGMLFDYEDGMDPGQEEAEEDGGWELVRAPKRSGSREKLNAAGKASTGPKGAGSAGGLVGADYEDQRRPLSKTQKKNMKRREKAQAVNEAARAADRGQAEKVVKSQTLPELRDKPVGY